MKIGVLVIATRFYKDWLPQFEESVNRYFLPDHEVSICSFTDDTQGVVEIPSYGFPEATLCRYALFNHHEHLFDTMDYLFYMDVDMKVVQPVGDEILSPLTVVQHAGYKSGQGTWETNPQSTAYAPNHHPYYFAGGFQGGATHDFLRMCYKLKRNIEDDLAEGITAIWHDESHLNAYMADQSPRVLPPAYCYPEERNEGEGKILCLYKDNSWKWKSETYPS